QPLCLRRPRTNQVRFLTSWRNGQWCPLVVCASPLLGASMRVLVPFFCYEVHQDLLRYQRYCAMANMAPARLVLVSSSSLQVRIEEVQCCGLEAADLRLVTSVEGVAALVRDILDGNAVPTECLIERLRLSRRDHRVQPPLHNEHRRAAVGEREQR